MNIHLGRGNANKLFARFLFSYADDLALELVNFTGGSLRNAIPREATIHFMLPNENKAKLEQAIAEYQDIVRAELSIADPDMLLTLASIDTPEKGNE